jgi:hypothetical protein
MSAIHHIHVTLHQSRRLQAVQQNITTEQNAVPLDAFELLFYQLLEIYNMCVAVRGSVFERKKQFCSIFICTYTYSISTGTVLCEHIFAFVTAL